MNIAEKKLTLTADASSSAGDPDLIKIVAVADGPRISLNLALNILISQKTFAKAEYHVAMPKSGSFGNAVAEEIIRRHAKSIFEIPDPTTVIENKPYRLENKINALKYFSGEPAMLADSDIVFLRPLPKQFLFRSVPAAVPEHGLHLYPWKRLFHLAGLNCPDFHVLLGSGEAGPPWLNAGLVVAPNAEKFGHIWKMMADYVLQCEWVPERWPYLDQIALPLAMAQFSNDRSLSYANVLPSQFNQNIFYWAGDQSSVRNGFTLHHHGRVGLLRKYIPDVISWIRADYPEIDSVLLQLSPYDKDE